jgi:hypothetical protein
MSRKRGPLSYKEPMTDPYDSDIDEQSYKSSTSKFNYVEEESLRIRILPNDSFLCIEKIPTDLEIPTYVKDLYLEDFSADEIKVFNPKKYPNMGETVSSFLIKLRLVVENNAQVGDTPREERFIDDMAIELMKAIKYDDGKNFTMRPCSLRLVVGDRSFAAEADREGRRGLDIIWIMQENKHIDDTRYSEGDVQLVSCMIAAYQANYRATRELYPEKMTGIKIKGDEVYFYSFRMTEEYLRSLSRGPPRVNLEVSKYPPKKGLSISNPVQRKELLMYLWGMRAQSLKLRDTF